LGQRGKRENAKPSQHNEEAHTERQLEFTQRNNIKRSRILRSRRTLNLKIG
jgi:hypothetical protein